MSLRNTSTSWGLVARLLHWLIFILIIGAWYAMDAHEGMPKGSPERARLMALHFSLGVSIFTLVWVRLGWRATGEIPAAIAGPRWQMLGAQLVHVGLYLILIAMPVTGLLTMQLEGHVVSWFGLVDIPVVLSPAKDVAEVVEEIHTDVLWPALLTLVGLHAAAAFWHHFMLKDDTLRRMTFPRR